VPRGSTERRRQLVTVLFTDIVGSTKRAEELGDARWRRLLTTHHAIVRRALKRHGGREIDTAGDGFFATFSQPSDAIDCAAEMIARLKTAGIDIRAGVHMGEVEVMDSGVGGIAVHVGARVMSKAEPGQILVSNTVRDLMSGSDLAFQDIGFHELKGVGAQVHLYSVRPSAPEAEPEPTTAEAAEPAVRRRRIAVVAAVGVLFVAAAVAVLLVVLRGSSAATFVPAPNTVADLSPTSNDVIGGVEVGTTPTGLAFGDGLLWVANFDDKTVQSIDVATRTAGPAKGGVLTNPTGIAVGGGFVWVTNGFSGQVVKIDPNQANLTTATDVGSGVAGLAYGSGQVWIAQADQGVLIRLDAVTGSHQPVSLPAGAQPVDVAIGAGSVWVADGQGGRVLRVDPATLHVTVIPLLSGHPDRIAFGEGFVWVTSTDADSLTRIDPKSGQPTTVDHVGNGPLGVAAGDGGVWVANSLDGTVARIDPRSAKVVGRVHLGFSPDAVAVTPDGVWVSLHQL
jgi:class 3 adenylate cyclase/streptogramin lyase